MHLQKYAYTISASGLVYMFESFGPNGVIPKVVCYVEENIGDLTFLNLVFGNMTGIDEEVDVTSISNNGDRVKLLATVAATVVEVTSRFPEKVVFAKGTTAARTRLYQMAMYRYWELITPRLEVFGHRNGRWMSAEKHNNYGAFAVIKKTDNKNQPYAFSQRFETTWN